MSPNPEPTNRRSLTCVLARPGRYEIVWKFVDSQPSAAATIPISLPVYRQIVTLLGAREPEAGGLLLGPCDNRLVTHFLFDGNGSCTRDKYTMDHAGLNEALRPFHACGINVKGIVHSHSRGRPNPSEGDRAYLVRLLNNPRNSAWEVYFPIFCDGQLHAFVITRDSLRRETRWAVPARIELL